MRQLLRLYTRCCLGVVVACVCALVSAARAQEPGDGSSAFDSAQARRADADTLKALSADGQLLYQRERVKLTGYQYCSQAVAAAERGDFRDSVRAASKALFLGQQQGNDDLVAVSKRDLAIAYSYAGDLDRAAQYAREALGHEARDPAIVAGPAYKTLGDVAVRRGQLAQAIGFYTQAAEAASERFRPLVEISLANAYATHRDAKQARALYERIAVPSGPLLPLYRRGLGNLLLVEGKPADALKAFESAAQTARGSDASYHRLWALEGMARSLLALGDKAAARARYVEAAQLADGVRSRFRSEEFKVGLFGDVQKIFEQAIGLLADAGDYAAAWQLSEQSRSRALLDVVRDRVAPAEASAAPVRLAELAAALRPGETLVEFHSLDDRLLAWTIGRAGLEGTSLPLPRAELDAAIDAFRQAIFERRRNAADIGAALYAQLLAPLELPAGARLIIVPHGGMHYLPFQALRTPEGFLIERHALAIAPSASIALQLEQHHAGGSVPLVAFGNPANDAREDLPGAEREVRLISRFFPQSQVFVEGQASKARFAELAGAGRILHIAAHAEVDSLDPLQSRILLAGSQSDPGFLAAREIYGLDLRAVSLVTLSACESGLGRIARGDEMLGFTRSFLTAGASTLLVSLWPVADSSTELLMTTFYERLTKGEQAIDAMRDAQLAVLGNRRFAHPFFWAPFNLIGDWRLGA
jgi:CHAT domain-containing protein